MEAKYSPLLIVGSFLYRFVVQSVGTAECKHSANQARSRIDATSIRSSAPPTVDQSAMQPFTSVESSRVTERLRKHLHWLEHDIMPSGKPHIVFGAGGIGSTNEDSRLNFTYRFHDVDTVNTLLSALLRLGIIELDSAASYPPGNPWNTERLLGETDAAKKGFIIDSKVIAVKDGVAIETLREQGIRDSLGETLRLNKAPRLRTLYAHFPQRSIPLIEQAEGFDKVFREGGFERLGLSNYSTEEMQEYFEICEKHGFVKPSVYQGEYNSINRKMEDDLLPLLRKHNCAYYAYSPLAGGFLTGKVTFAKDKPNDDTLKRTRWNQEGGLPSYQAQYLHDECHDQIRNLKKVCDSADPPLTVQEASLRWIMNHSALKEGDAIILGASFVKQFESNLADCQRGPLPKDVLDTVNRIWEKVKHLVTIEMTV